MRTMGTTLTGGSRSFGDEATLLAGALDAAVDALGDRAIELRDASARAGLDDGISAALVDIERLIASG